MGVARFKTGYQDGFQRASRVIANALARSNGRECEDPKPLSGDRDYMEGYRKGQNKALRLALDEVIFCNERDVDRFATLASKERAHTPTKRAIA